MGRNKWTHRKRRTTTTNDRTPIKQRREQYQLKHKLKAASQPIPIINKQVSASSPNNIVSISYDDVIKYQSDKIDKLQAMMNKYRQLYQTEMNKRIKTELDVLRLIEEEKIDEQEEDDDKYMQPLSMSMRPQILA